MVRTIGLLWIVVQPTMLWPQSLWMFALMMLVRWVTHDGTLGIYWFGRVFCWPLGYIIIRVQVEGVLGYNEDQVALVILDSTGFGSQVLVSLGTSTIKQIINRIKESEINELSVSLNGSRIAQLLACQWAELLIQRKTVTNQAVDPTDLNEVVKSTKKEEVDAFSSKIIHDQMKTLLLGNNMHVMIQSLRVADGPHLPPGLSVVNTYTKVISGSKQVVVVVKNLMATPSLLPRVSKSPKWLLQMLYPPVKLTPNILGEIGWDTGYPPD